VTGIGLVGCGLIGTAHSFAIRQLADLGVVEARVTEMYDTDPDRATRLARHHGAHVAPDLDTLLRAVDVVWVCTWTGGHREVVEAAAAVGLPVFCEKPLAPTLAECEQVAVALRTVPHQVGLVLRQSPVFRAMAEAVVSGRHGRPLAAVLRDDQYFPIQGMYESTWRSDVSRAGGGTLLEHSIHDVDILRFLFGDPEMVSARTASVFGYPGIDDTAAMTLSYAGGHVASLVSVWHQVTSRPTSRRLEVFCERAFLWTDDDYLGPLHVVTRDGEDVVAGLPPPWLERFTTPEVVSRALGPYAEQARSFLDALGADGTGRGAPDVEVALAAHRLVDLGYRSAAEGGRPLRAPECAPEARPAR